MMVELRLGAEVDLLTRNEVEQSVKDAFDQAEVARLRGIRWMRLPEILQGTASGSAITLGETKGQILGPRQGYVWSIRRLLVNGLTSGATPDVVNLYRGTALGIPLWQFNGNNFGYTFNGGQLTLMGGENLALASVGTLSATGQITLAGELIEAPAELMGKLAL